MADAPAGTKGKGLEFLKQKVGPLPLGVWLAGGLGVWYYLQRKQAAPAAGAQLTDPAGNTCSALNPETGFCPGTDQDIAALNAAAGNVAAGQAAAGDTSGGTTDTGGGDTGTTSGTGATDTSGGSATGAPTGGPSPTPPPVTAPPVNPKWSYPAPGGLRASNVAATGYYLNWNPVKGPGGQVPPSYTVATYASSGKLVNQHVTSAGSTQTAEYGEGGKGLPKGTYHSNVWANGGPQAPPHATVSVTLKG